MSSSYARLKRNDGLKVSINFKDMMEVYRHGEELVAQHTSLLEKLEELDGYRTVIRKQIEELPPLWDEEHTRAIRKAMGSCAEDIDTAIQYFEALEYDLKLLIGAADGVNNWLAANPDYNHIYKANDGTMHYYARQTRTGHKHKRTTYEGKTLDFPA